MQTPVIILNLDIRRSHALRHIKKVIPQRKHQNSTMVFEKVDISDAKIPSIPHQFGIESQL
jgi:hypothetical protein